MNNNINNPLTDVFQKEGTSSIIGGNTPFLLDDPDAVWYVRSGQVEIFSVNVREHHQTGARYHFFTAQAGDILLGIDLEKTSMEIGFLAVGLIDTKIYKISSGRFRELAENPGNISYAAKLLDKWIEGLSYGISKDINTHTDLLIEPVDEMEVEDGNIIRSKKGVAWASYAEGNTLFIGMEEVGIEGAKALVPVTQDTWLQTIGRTRLSVVNTEVPLTNGDIWQGLVDFHKLLFQCEFMNIRLAEVDEFNRLKTKADYETTAREEALSQLVSVLQCEGAQETFSGDHADKLFMSAWEVCHAMGISIKAPPKSKNTNVVEDPLEQICNVSQIRKRMVNLTEKWWAEDCGPILAFYKDSGLPVALLPTSARSYVLYDPEKRTKISVNKMIASLLKPDGFVFYRCFSDKPLSGKELFKFCLFGTRSDIVTLTIVGIAGALLGLFMPWATKIVFDTIIPGAERIQLTYIIIAILISAFGIGIFEFTRNIAFLRIEGKLSHSLQSAFIDRLLNLPVKFFRRFSAGDLNLRVMSISQIKMVLPDVAVNGLLMGMFSIFYVGQMFYYHATLGWVACGLIMFNILFILSIGYVALGYLRQIHAIKGKISAMVLQFLTGISKLRVAGSESQAFAKWAQSFTHQRNLTFKAMSIQNMNMSFNSAFIPLIANIAIYSVFVSLLPNALDGNNTPETVMSTGEFLAFNTAFATFMISMVMATQSFLMAISVLPLWERTRPIFEEKPEIDKMLAGPGELTGCIQIDHITFRYAPDGSDVLKDVSVSAGQGEFIAIVGPSGSGKSTLMRLLLGFEKPDTGAIYYDGQDLAQIDKRSLRQKLGVVLQNSSLLSGTILTNIIGATLKTMDDAWEAASMACLKEDIEQMPMGMHTVVSQGGNTLSGGQRQRILIARALTQKPSIIFFDEASSALDNRTQKIVSDSLDKLRATRIVIAHRLSTIIHADMIYVLEKGRIVQSGNYEELVNRKGLFAELVKRQLE